MGDDKKLFIGPRVVSAVARPAGVANVRLYLFLLVPFFAIGCGGEQRRASATPATRATDSSAIDAIDVTEPAIDAENIRDANAEAVTDVTDGATNDAAVVAASVSPSRAPAPPANRGVRRPTPTACRTASDCVPNSVCMPSTCVAPSRADRRSGCPDVVWTTQVTCACEHARCVSYSIEAGGL